MNFLFEYWKWLLAALMILVIGLAAMIFYKNASTEIKIQHDRFHKIQNK